MGAFWRSPRRAVQLCRLVETKNKPDNLKKIATMYDDDDAEGQAVETNVLREGIEMGRR